MNRLHNLSYRVNGAVLRTKIECGSHFQLSRKRFLKCWKTFGVIPKQTVGVHYTWKLIIGIFQIFSTTT